METTLNLSLLYRILKNLGEQKGIQLSGNPEEIHTLVEPDGADKMAIMCAFKVYEGSLLSVHKPMRSMLCLFYLRKHFINFISALIVDIVFYIAKLNWNLALLL